MPRGIVTHRHTCPAQRVSSETTAKSSCISPTCSSPQLSCSSRRAQPRRTTMATLPALSTVGHQTGVTTAGSSQTGTWDIYTMRIQPDITTTVSHARFLETAAAASSASRQRLGRDTVEPGLTAQPAFNITGPTVTAPAYDPSVPPPTILIPGFRATCSWDDRSPDLRSSHPCSVDISWAPTPPWKDGKYQGKEPVLPLEQSES